MTFFCIVIKYRRYAKTMRKPSSYSSVRSEREPVKALTEPLQATSCVARDDRDGRSRYRVSKISPVWR